MNEYWRLLLSSNEIDPVIVDNLVKSLSLIFSFFWWVSSNYTKLVYDLFKSDLLKSSIEILLKQDVYDETLLNSLSGIVHEITKYIFRISMIGEEQPKYLDLIRVLIKSDLIDSDSLLFLTVSIKKIAKSALRSEYSHLR